jgi:hypothetical protein
LALRAKSFIQTDQADLHAMTQIVDSNDYVRTVIGREPHHVDVLTGFLANQITSFLNGLPFDIFQDNERAMALCLDFPSLSQTSITALLTKLAGQFGLAASPLIMKDIWWPTKGDSPNSRVMTHEYGHFLMCDMFYAEKGPAGLTPLMGRVVEGQNDSPDDDLAITTEAWADLFSMQVTGASNYIEANNATQGKMKYCQSGGSCLDYNYRGVGYYPDDATARQQRLAKYVSKSDAAGGKAKLGFYEELARTESILQDLFDRGDSTFRETDQPWNGDVLKSAGVYSTTPYLGFADENVSLGGSAWKKWAERWAELGPNVSREGIIGSLHHVAKQSHNWCQRCELFALHDKDGKNVQGRADLDAMATAQDRWARWKQCKDYKIDYFGETPPEPHLNLSPSCTPCAPGEFADTKNGGVCTACPTGEIPRGNACEKCLPGLVPGPNNECVARGVGQISVGNVCTACAFGQGADRATNTCVDCTPDASLDWNTLGDPGCQAVLAEVKAQPTPAANDICPDYTWIELKNLDALVAQQRDTLNIEVVPEDLFSGPFAGSGTPLSGIIQKLLCPTYSLALLGYTPRLGDPNVAWGMDHGQSDAKGHWGSCVGEPWCENLDDESCLWNARVEYTAPEITAAGNRVRFLAVAAQGSGLVPLRLLLTGSQPNTKECAPK